MGWVLPEISLISGRYLPPKKKIEIHGLVSECREIQYLRIWGGGGHLLNSVINTDKPKSVEAFLNIWQCSQ